MRATVDGIGDRAVRIAALGEFDQAFEGFDETLAMTAAHGRAPEELGWGDPTAVDHVERGAVESAVVAGTLRAPDVERTAHRLVALTRCPRRIDPPGSDAQLFAHHVGDAQKRILSG